MNGPKYTSGLLAELAKTPHVRSMGVPTTPDGRECKTTLLDVDDAELMSMTEDCGADGSRFGLILGHEVEKVAVSVIEETYADTDMITSFFEDETSGEPWLVVVEPD